MCLYNRVIGEKSVTHGAAPPFPLSAASSKLDMPSDCAACPAALFSDFFLRQVLEVIQKDFLLRLFRQPGKSSRKGDFPFPPRRQHTGSVKGRMANTIRQ